MYNSERILKGRKDTKAQADRMWDRIYQMALNGDVQPTTIGAAMQQCNKAHKALLDDESRERIRNERYLG